MQPPSVNLADVPVDYYTTDIRKRKNNPQVHLEKRFLSPLG